jgi:hypothetical protein
MLKRYLRAHNPAMWLLGLLLVSLILAACGGTPEPAEVPSPAADTETAADTPAAEEEVEATAEQATATAEVAEAEEAAATEESETHAAAEATEEENLLADASTTLAECQTMDIPDNDLIGAVSEDDWVKGPANAPVTLIEYGDYQ